MKTYLNFQVENENSISLIQFPNRIYMLSKEYIFT